MKHQRAACASAIVCALLSMSASADVFINELHYDNSGTDLNEKVEIVGPAGTSLTGWKVLLYNGSDGLSYATVNLSGTLPSQCGGHGTLAFNVTGIQNGNPDGVALVNASGALVQFLSYGGTFTGSGGAANGVLSKSIGVAESSTTTSTQSLQLKGTGTTAAQFTWNAPSTASFGSCNAGQTFPVSTPDVAPTVSSTTPANAATGVATTANVVVNFSEAVTVGTSWYTLNCSVSGSHPGVTSGSGSSRTINPNVDFTGGESCTLTVLASGVSDTDGTVTPMAANASVSFTVAGSLPVDTAPTVSSVSPANGATNVARTANVSVNFSESVTLAAGWYTLTCASTGSKTATQSGSGSSYTLDPSVDFGSLESCTFTVIASKVTDVDGSPTLMASNYSATFTTTTAATGYYASVVTSSAAQLRTTLHNVIDDHTKFPYTATTTDTWDILDRADQDPLNSTRILDIYKNASYAKAGGGNTFYNREHTWPKSLGFPDDVPTNYPYTDTHMLMASDIGHNSARGNLPFGNCGAGAVEFATLVYNGAGGAGQSNWQCGGYWQVWNKLKGNVARAMFYMDVRYEGGTHGVTGAAEPNLILTDNASLITQSTGNASVAYMGLLSVLLQWHQQDPVDAQEQLRNDVIYSYQGNRNPFVDHPEWVACIFQSVCS